jgi:hypothetical protein
MKNLLIMFFLFVSFHTNAQVKLLYNWKGNNLPLYAKPDTKSNILINIPKGGSVQKIDPAKGSPSNNIVLSYYGSTAPPENGDAYGTGGTFYVMPGNWVMVSYQGKKGYVPDLFLSRLADLQSLKTTDNSFEEIAADYLARLFGTPVSNNKKELPKESKDEINYEKTYCYKNGNYLLASFSYFEEGGPGGETYKLFLKGLKKHEAVLLLLKLTSYNNTIDNVKKIKKRQVTNSPYDQFSWWYNKGDKQDQNVDLEFFYEQEGGSSKVTLTETKDGVIVSYGFGGC